MIIRQLKFVTFFLNNNWYINYLTEIISFLKVKTLKAFLKLIFFVTDWIVTAYAGKTYFEPVLTGLGGFFLFSER